MKSETKYSLGVRLKYRLFYALFYTLGLLPGWFLYYPLAWTIYVLIYRVIGYRVKITRDNLALAFPDKSETERRTIERKYYRWMAELFIDEIDMASMTERQIKRRFVVNGEAEFMAKAGGKDFLAALGHYAQWDFFSAFALTEPSREVIGVFNPPTDIAFMLLVKRVRQRFGMKIYPMATILRRIIENRREERIMTVGLVADQTPPRREIDHWYNFFGTTTAFYSGAEKLARRFKMPIYFLHTDHVKPGHYVCTPELLWDGVEEVAEWEITERYVQLLEGEIRKVPHLWLWSHRRWKHKPLEDEI